MQGWKVSSSVGCCSILGKACSSDRSFLYELEIEKLGEEVLRANKKVWFGADVLTLSFRIALKWI